MRGLTIRIGDDGYRVEEFDGGLRELQAAVGGYVEAIPSDPVVTMWVNEDGKGQELPINKLAMDVWIRWDVHRCLVVGRDWLAGNVVVTGGADAEGESQDLPDEARRWVLRVAHDAGVKAPR